MKRAGALRRSTLWKKRIGCVRPASFAPVLAHLTKRRLLRSVSSVQVPAQMINAWLRLATRPYGRIKINALPPHHWKPMQEMSEA